MNPKRLIEALLFAAGEPLTAAQIAESIDDLDAGSVKGLLLDLQAEYDMEARGFQLVEVSNGYQLTTRPAYSDWVRRLFRREIASKLSTASLETLAIVAYNQPVTRSEVEEIRGVNSDSALNSLAERQLIAIAGRKEVPGRPLLYATTDKFLHHFGLKDLSELPSLEELEQLFTRPPGDAPDAT
ncbi:SMC-Scp complex subunit ScpB [Candidatus Poribacteria bacterium]|nr:SMC-Scp complex subunit ScpB [Candidatus Poribacteria bacterium]